MTCLSSSSETEAAAGVLYGGRHASWSQKVQLCNSPSAGTVSNAKMERGAV